MAKNLKANTDVKKVKKMSTVLTVWSLVILIVLNVIMAILTGTISRYLIGEKEKKYLQQIQISAQNQIEDFIQNHVVIAEMLARDVDLQNALVEEGNFSQSGNFANSVEVFTSTKNYYDAIMEIAVGSKKEDILYTSDSTRTDVQLSSRVYNEAIVQNKTYITQPYIDQMTGKMCVSIAAPIQKNGQAVGLVNLDLNLDIVSKLLESMAFDETGRLLLMGADQTIIGYHETSLVGKPISDAGLDSALFKKVLDSGTTEPFKYKLNNETKIGMIVPLPEYNWALLIGLMENEYYKDSNQIQLALAILMLLNMTITALWLRRIISKRLSPISKISSGLMEMSEGNLQMEKISHDADDEIGEMADSMQECVTHLSMYISEIDNLLEAFADGDLTYHSNIEFKGDFQSIQNAIERFRTKLETLLRDISESAEQVSSGSDQVAAGAQSLAQGATEQASSVEELAASIAEVSEQIKHNADTAKAANEQNALTGVALDKCNQQMEHMNSVMKEISDGSEKISHIIKTIEDIAFQTNILALNAAVEAARAGASGKGFAVVASEVGSLSYKSSEASKEIAQLIDTSLRSVHAGTTATKNTSEALKDVLEQAQNVTVLVDKIAEASDAQAAAITQINQGVAQISNVVQTTSATAEESAAASEELSSQAGMLRQSVQQFKLENQYM